MHTIILEPLITEKSIQLASRGWYTFRANRADRKRKILESINQQFKVHVVKIKTLIVKRKTKRTGKKRQVVNDTIYKKAIVKLKQGEKIEVFGVEQGSIKK